MTYVTTMPQTVPGSRVRLVQDANRHDKVGMLKLLAGMVLLILRERPDVVVSTGAAPGYMALRIARLLGARTVWIDSFANVETLSMSGRLVGPHADLWLTQWEHLATPTGPTFAGTVI